MCLSTRWSDTFTAVDLLFSALSSHGQPVTPEHMLPDTGSSSIFHPWPSLHSPWPHVMSLMKPFPNLGNILVNTTTLEVHYLFVSADTVCQVSIVLYCIYTHIYVQNKGCKTIPTQYNQLFPWNFQPHHMVLNSSGHASLVTVWLKIKRE